MKVKKFGTVTTDGKGTESALTKMLDAHRDDTYCGIYCKRCGKVINA